MTRTLLILAALAGSFPLPAPAAAPPNVVLLMIDDLNDWVGCLGGHPNSKTPNIDRLASRGTVFTNAHTAAPLCGPSRAAFWTGLLPSSTGIYGMIGDSEIRQVVGDGTRFLSEHFSAAGYETLGKGKLFHHGAPDGVFDTFDGRSRGFGPKPKDAFVWDQKGTSTDWGAFPDDDAKMPDSATATWAADQLLRDHDRPFFLAAGFLRPHVPWYVPPRWFDAHPLDAIKMPPYKADDWDDIPAIAREVASVPMMPTTEWCRANGEWKKAVQGYLASVTFVDSCVGTVLDAIEAGGHAEDTIIVLLSDHGYHLGEKNRFAKHGLWQRATRVPLIIARPGLAGGTNVAEPASLIDVFPTLLDLCGLPPAPRPDGRSLVPLLDGTRKSSSPAVTTYGRGNHAVSGLRYRLIRYEDGSEEFYDLHQDPNEWHNRASDPRYADAKAVLAESLPGEGAAWVRQSNYDGYPYFKRQRARDLAE